MIKSLVAENVARFLYPKIFLNLYNDYDRIMIEKFLEVILMPQIRPITDLRNKFADISRIVHEEGQPIFLTKNGYGDMVVMSIETYERMALDSVIANKLRQSELVAESTDVRYDFDEVSNEMREKLIEKL